MLKLLFGSGDDPHAVYFTRDIENGILRSWTIVARSRKLKLTNNGNKTFNLRLETDRLFSPEREASLMAEKPRPAGPYSYDCWVIVRLGRTSKGKGDLEKIFQGLRAKYTNPRRLTWGSLSWEQSQECLRVFAAGIVDEQRADHHAWFVANLEAERKSADKLPRPLQNMPMVYNAEAHIPWLYDERVSHNMQQKNIRDAEQRRIDRFGILMAGAAANARAQQQQAIINQQIVNNQGFGGYGS